MRYSRDSDDDFDDDGDEGLTDDDAIDTAPCPYCGQEIYEEAERCPHCERYISDVDSAAAPKPWLIAVGVVLCLVIVYFWIFRGW